MAVLEITSVAAHDIREILLWTEQRFGRPARTRYEALLSAGLRDLKRDPLRIGSRARSELGEGFRTYHLRHSRVSARSLPGRVGTPRHFILYFLPRPKLVVVSRVLHDAMDPLRHVPASSND